MQVFFPKGLVDGKAFLDFEEAKHCIKVLRHKKGDHIHITDGEGNLYLSEITNDRYESCELKIIEKINIKPKGYHLHIAISPLKNQERFDWFIEKATELGVDEITPLICKNTERPSVKEERIRKIIISAVKQSMRVTVPVLNPPVKIENLRINEFSGKKMVAYCVGDERKMIGDVYCKNENAFILIGPEGDFSPEEVNFLKNNNFTEISLGENRLRTETAGIYTAAVIKMINEA